MLVVLVLGFLIASLYTLYYRNWVVEVPQVVCCDDRRRKALKEHCPALFKPFFPTVWAPQAHMQTLCRSVLQTCPLKQLRRREMVVMSDGGHVCIDWFNDHKPSQPTVIILPGLAGSSDENYIQHWIDDIIQQAYRCVVYNYRGCGKSKLSNTKMYCGANIEDLEDVLDHLHNTLPAAPLLAVGVSLGSTQLIRYLSNCKRLGKECYLKAILLASSIWDVSVSYRNMEYFFNKHLINRFLTSQFVNIMKENRVVFDSAHRQGALTFDYENAIKSVYLRDLANRAMIPMFGYANMEDYLEDWSPCNRLDGITIPTLVVNALDDPFSPLTTLPMEEAQKNPNLMLAITKRGGHIGFLEGLLPFSKSWMDKVLVQFINMAFEQDTL